MKTILQKKKEVLIDKQIEQGSDNLREEIIMLQKLGLENYEIKYLLSLKEKVLL